MNLIILSSIIALVITAAIFCLKVFFDWGVEFFKAYFSKKDVVSFILMFALTWLMSYLVIVDYKGLASSPNGLSAIYLGIYVVAISRVVGKIASITRLLTSQLSVNYSACLGSPAVEISKNEDKFDVFIKLNEVEDSKKAFIDVVTIVRTFSQKNNDLISYLSVTTFSNYEAEILFTIKNVGKGDWANGHISSLDFSYDVHINDIPPLDRAYLDRAYEKKKTVNPKIISPIIALFLTLAALCLKVFLDWGPAMFAACFSIIDAGIFLIIFVVSWIIAHKLICDIKKDKYSNVIPAFFCLLIIIYSISRFIGAEVTLKREITSQLDAKYSEYSVTSRVGTMKYKGEYDVIIRLNGVDASEKLFIDVVDIVKDFSGKYSLTIIYLSIDTNHDSPSQHRFSLWRTDTGDWENGHYSNAYDSYDANINELDEIIG